LVFPGPSHRVDSRLNDTRTQSRNSVNIRSPYLWSFSNHYDQGKFRFDGQFDRDLVSDQCGAAVLLKSMVLGGDIAFPDALADDAPLGVQVTAADPVYPGHVVTGMLFIMSTGGGHGHTRIVEKVVGGRLVTIEGNTSFGGSPEGIGVFRRDTRQVDSINKGFIAYGSV
jgi:hypothetical protein